jgi:acyl-coenzyme A synthetase/AMP-(fatty) acid ligase
LGRFIKTYLQQEETGFPNLVNDIIHRWAIAQPTKEALSTCETNNNECQKLSFNDVYKQAARFANVLTGKEFNLKPGATVRS